MWGIARRRRRKNKVKEMLKKKKRECKGYKEGGGTPNQISGKKELVNNVNAILGKFCGV